MNTIIYIELDTTDNKNYLQDQKSILWLLTQNKYIVWEVKKGNNLFIGAKKSHCVIGMSSFDYIPVTKETAQDVLLAFVKAEKMVYCFDEQSIYYNDKSYDIKDEDKKV